MEVTLLPDKRKATVIGSISSKVVKVRLEDGREVPWPVDRIQQPAKEGEETLKVVKIPAIDRLVEFYSDMDKIFESLPIKGLGKYGKLWNDLFNDAVSEFEQKWGYNENILVEDKPPEPNTNVKFE